MSTQVQAEPIVVADLTVMSRDEWLKARKSFLGASDAAAACGMDPYRSALKLWAEMTGRIQPQPAGEAADLGLKLEPLVAELFTERSGIAVTPSTEWLQHPELPFLRATLDYYVDVPGMVYQGRNVRIPVECKTRSAWLASEYADDQAPDKHLIQLAVQMAVTGAPHGYLATLIGGQQFVWKKVERDLALEQLILSLLVKFWEHVQSGTQPSTTAADNAFMAKLYPTATRTEPVILTSAKNVIERYRAAQQTIKRAEQERDEAAAALKVMMGGADTGVAGEYKVTWRMRQRIGYTVEASSYRHFEVRTSRGVKS